MGKLNSFKDLIVWRKSHLFVCQTYKLVSKYPKFEEFGLSSQTRRSAVSIPSNIAEGFKRKSNNDSLRYYNIAEASLEETKYQLLLARDLCYIGEAEFTTISDLADEVGKLLYSWIKSQKA